jgi:hypothetical protein
MIVAAANNGERCPTNAQIAERCGGQSVSMGANIVNFLEVAGIIRVARYRAGRVVEIVATGKCTAGNFSGAIQEYGKGSRRIPNKLISHPTEIMPALPEKAVPVIIDRSPCPRCATRADVGCVHSERLAA